MRGMVSYTQAAKRTDHLLIQPDISCASDTQTQRELLNARRSRMPRVRRGYESKNDCIDYGAVLCRGSMLGRRRIYGHLEAERSQVKAHPRRAKEQLGCLRGCG